MSLLLHHNDLLIEIFDDPEYPEGSDSAAQYGKTIQVDSDRPYRPNARHAVKVFRRNTLLQSAILLASGGAMGIDDHSALIDGEALIIRCCNKLFSLSLPGLDLNWVAVPDWATCFSIHRHEDSYITHGEVSIARVDRSGTILWSFEGADIFVCLDEGTPFEMLEDRIELTDFNGGRYRIDYNGNLLD